MQLSDDHWFKYAVKKVSGFFQELSLSEFRSKRCEFYEELAKSMENREQIKTFLVEELKIAKDPKTKNASRAAAFSKMYRSLSLGEEFALSKILGGIMPKDDALMLTALDHTKNKSETLRILASSLREQDLVRGLITKAIVPPLVLLPGIAGFSYVMATQSLPIMIKMSPPSVWTPFNQAVRIFCEFVADDGAVLVVVSLIVIAAYKYALPNWSGKLRAKLEQLPTSLGLLLFPVCPFILPLSVYRDFQVSILLSSMAVLLQSGMTLTESLRSLIPESTPWMRWHLKRILFNLQVSPADYIDAFSRGLIGPTLLAKISSSIRQTPHFDRLIIKLGTTEGAQIRQQIQGMTKSINVFILVLLSSVILFLYIGQFSISQDLTDALSSGRGLK